MTVATKIALFNSLFLVVLVFGALALPVIYCQEKIYRQLENPETKFAGLEKNVNWWGVWGIKNNIH